MNTSWDLFGKISGAPFPYCGMPVYENPALVETAEYTVTTALTWRQRWVDPFLHPATVPFEPWIKEKSETRYRPIPSRQIFQTPQGLIMHPAMAAELRRQLANR